MIKTCNSRLIYFSTNKLVPCASSIEVKRLVLCGWEKTVVSRHTCEHRIKRDHIFDEAIYLLK